MGGRTSRALDLQNDRPQTNGISPFALTYRMEAIILIEIGMPTLRMDMPEQLSTESIIKELDMADELRETTAVRVASYHRRMANLYKRRVKSRVFEPGDLVLRKVFKNTANPVVGSFRPIRKGRIL